MPFVHSSFSAEKLRRRKATGWIANLALILCSLAAGLLLAEIAVRLLAPQSMNGTVFEYAPRGYSVIKSKGTALFSIGGNTGVYHFVSPHLRGERPPPRGAERLLALGDSFTFGVGLSERDTYIARLQEKLDATFGSGRIALLNAGIPGSGTAEHLAFLEDFGDEIAPAAVFAFVSIDDFNRAERSPLYHLRNAETLALDAGSEPTSRLKTIISNSDVYDFSIQHIQLAQLIRNAVIRIVFRSSRGQMRSINNSSPDQQRLARGIFRRMKAWCDSRGIKLAVINNGWRSYDWLADLLASERIAFFDAAPQVQPLIARNRAAHVIAGDRHPNAAGAALTAGAVWPFVRNFINENDWRPQR